MASPPLPNPNTPLAFLPPDLADQYEISRHIYTATIGAFIWDILTHLPEDYRLLFKYRVRLPTVAYFFSRILSLAYVTTSTVFQISKVGDCQKLQVALGWCFCLAVSSTSFLFFLRVRAIFERNQFVIACFFILWLAVFGGTMTVPFAINGGHIGPTKYCINTGVKPFSSAGIIVSSVNDALVLLAISWRIVTAVSIDDSFTGLIRSFFGKGQLPALSKAVLQSGQQYYAITVSLNILSLVMILVPSVPPVYHAMFTIPNVALMNSMACRVYRNIRFGTMLADPSVIFRTTMNNSATLPVAFPPSRRSDRSNTNGYYGSNGIGITKTVEHARDQNVPMDVILPASKEPASVRSVDNSDI
ncbi:hypothetical protein AMATHDRAFT_145912 [Amanita thiersii Skay4041]|uniref:Uncharacterized protein n=1 Tax=Amanita thiersii Skay4041 TaxID=703135 RepID=A0A2A9NP60_9AGAR|nr:hypothetical protein AMATHDRAFT_145912 [Amanita thiersii Skay4041]